VTSTPTRFQCPHCKKSHRGPVAILPFYCRCGAVLHDITYTRTSPQVIDDLGCRHRGGELREINCGCSGKPKIYSCEKHGEAYLRKLPKMTPEMVAGCTMCLTCEDRERYAKGRLGVVAEVHNKIGGTETYWRTIAKHLGLQGIATPRTPKHGSTLYPVFGGELAIEELAASVDTLIVWGVTGLAAQTKGPTRIAMHHGSLASTWANAVFEDELKWCERAIAINEEVAKHYGCEYLANCVDVQQVQAAKWANKKIALWLHRDSAEKRPWLVRKIAQALPPDWLMVASLPKDRECENLMCIGQVEDVAFRLAQADVFVSTAEQEGFGLSVAEAMALGVPVVSSPYGIGANAELVEQVESEDPQAWVNAILRAGAKATAAKAYIDANHSPEAWVKAWEKVLATIPAKCPAD